MSLKLSDVLTAIVDREVEVASDRDVEFSDVVVDSRLVRPGSLFVALPGENTDGHVFLEDAFRMGAAGALVERPEGPGQLIRSDAGYVPSAAESSPSTTPVRIMVSDALAGLQRIAGYWRRCHQACRVIGITGSVGKTSVKELSASVLSQRYCTLRSEGNYNNEIGLPLALLSITRRHERAVLEMAMYDLGEIALLADIALPNVGVVTNVGPTHLERLGTIDRIAQAKAELIRALPADGVAILNGDDSRVRAMGDMALGRRTVTFGLGQDVDLRATGVRSQGLRGVSFQLHYQGKTVPAHTCLLGAHSVMTALAAAAVGVTEGLTWDDIRAGLAAPGAEMRLRPVPGINGSTLLDDSYNSSPASALAALEALGDLAGTKIAVLGDMLELGSYEEEGHRVVGRQAAAIVSELYVLGSRARIMAQEAIGSGLPADKVHIMSSRDDVVTELRSRLQQGDVALVKASRGMAMDQVIDALRCAGAPGGCGGM